MYQFLIILGIEKLLQFPCETIVRDILPAFKAFIVKELYNKYHFSQTKIANLLNITQASVSYHLHGERGYIGSELIHKNEQVKSKLLSIIEGLISESTTPENIRIEICDLCAALNREFGCPRSLK